MNKNTLKKDYTGYKPRSKTKETLRKQAKKGE